MRFTGIKESYKNVEYGAIERIENKQRISLSTWAYTVLQHDSEIFQIPGSEKPTDGVSSGFINHIFSCFRESAESSVAHTVQKQKISLCNKLDGVNRLPGGEMAVKLLVEDYEKELKDKAAERCEKKDHSIIIRVSADNQRFLLSDEGQAEGPVYNDKVGMYIKAVLEEYCELAYAEREQVFYRKHAEEIAMAVAQGKMLKLVLHNSDRKYVKPLGVRQDTERLYNYLVGMISPSREGPWSIGSVRLTSIRKCDKQELSVSLGRELKNIETAIREKGVQYLSDGQGSQRIVVKFTSQGERLYRRILHLRPQYVKIIEPLTYEFSCSVMQASNYFFKFGHDARIIEPISLAEQFHRKYISAVKSYEK